MSRHRASALWSGSLPTGTGTMTLGRKGPEIGFTLDARVREDTGTNPEQMLGAALAGYFSMSLTNLIEESGIARGQVPGMDEATFTALAEQSKATSPVSKLYSSATITLDAALA